MPGCGTVKPNWLQRKVRQHMSDKQTQTDCWWDWDKVVTYGGVGAPVASQLSFGEAYDAITGAGPVTLVNSVC